MLLLLLLLPPEEEEKEDMIVLFFIVSYDRRLLYRCAHPFHSIISLSLLVVDWGSNV